LFSGLTIEWNYDYKYVNISMPNYIPNMLHKFQYAPPPPPHQAPRCPPCLEHLNLWGKVQYAANNDDSPILPDAEITDIQQKLGTLLYCVVSIGPFMLVALGTIASAQSTAMQRTKDAC
jgi:hypothetical protein